MFKNIITILLFCTLFSPLISSILIGFSGFGSFFSKEFLKNFSIKAMLFAAVLSYFLFFFLYAFGEDLLHSGVICNAFIIEAPFNWMTFSDSCFVSWIFHFDFVTAVMFIVVTNVSFVVHLYSLDYMAADPNLIKFMSYLSLFTFFMLFLVISGNLVQLFIGWEGVGICSYLLINFWYTRIQANKAALKAVLVNKIGDCAFIFACGLVYWSFGTFDIFEINTLSSFIVGDTVEFFIWNIDTISLICFFFFLAAMAKSALFGLHVWLPDAMEGPTPVSALIHAATMVTAGVYLVIRLGNLFSASPSVMYFISFIGAATCFLGASVALVQYDMKKVIAYSTCSQLGYMVMACGLGQFGIALFHLATHAFFKALLFLSAGAVIHFLNDEQDIRKMGGLWFYMPNTFVYMIIGSLALAGFPFLSGFYSKELILELSLVHLNKVESFAIYLIGFISALLTAFYSMRLLYFVFLGKPKQSYTKLLSSSDIKTGDANSWFTEGPLVLLAVGSIFVGSFGENFFILLNNSISEQSMSLAFSTNSEILVSNAHALSWSVKILPVIGSIFAMLFCYFLNTVPFMYIMLQKMLSKGIGFKIHQFLLNKWYFDSVYNNYICMPIYRFGYYATYKNIEKGWLEFLGPTGFSKFFLFVSRFLSRLQTGFVYNYVFIMVFFTAVVCGFFELNYFYNFENPTSLLVLE